MPAEDVYPCRADPLGPQQHPDDEGERPEGDAEENPKPTQQNRVARGEQSGDASWGGLGRR